MKNLLLDEQNLLSRIESLYLYQLIYRYFSKMKNTYLEYCEWCNVLNKSPKDKWNNHLNRPVERFTINLLNISGFRAAVNFARLYNFLKKHIKKKQTVTEIL
jgi:hypothetical protein